MKKPIAKEGDVISWKFEDNDSFPTFLRGNTYTAEVAMVDYKSKHYGVYPEYGVDLIPFENATIETKKSVMRQVALILEQCPDKPCITVTYSKTWLEGEGLNYHKIEVESIHCDGDISSLLAWYTYDKIIAEVTEFINDCNDEKD